MHTQRTTDSLAPFRRRARLRQVWRWLRWVLLVLVVITLLLGGVLLRLGRADTGISVAHGDDLIAPPIYTQAISPPAHDGGHV